ncbi:hypothetical protein [Cryobacterium sp. Y11]|uniref:hypothetical protein n=1 Tax=Cryobacterium sp. Y11 TaxID=2045016 RepID=UPI000CE4677E|nr:hypothetical protein [Cryobacterium sp. Y11]
MTLPLGTLLHVGEMAVVTITGMRSPCSFISSYQKSLMKQLIRTNAAGSVERRGGIMGVVTVGGEVTPGDSIRVQPPAGEHLALGVVSRNRPPHGRVAKTGHTIRGRSRRADFRYCASAELWNHGG